ncbi:sensor histidine kinase [Roseivirga pacifica]|uniref:sensor histidine kinase n=2 Tax=Roseivirga pacifica TaxID=1267423 RepID=UPI00209527D1|nr:histidine kinase [Roseivirga pacifica]MCO6359235.1 hypothetical protein [Roseivirga pacifica]MCO6365129.1 hypothetical protein [Roseivirga pacifica]MCO6372141.1 hypothetical protein [Roseivirga pacifica]MCO6375748.1 hypothetical protein [Roseivirga pacifica]MCO6379519.1 hypothetical protein [Roseivirga pacifica]
MKKAQTFQLSVIVVLIMFFAEKYFQLETLHGYEYYNRILDITQSEQVAKQFLLLYKVQKLSEYLVLLAIAFASSRFLFTKLELKTKWYISIPVTLFASSILGLIFSLLLSFINPYYSITANNGLANYSEIRMFSHLFLRQSIHVFLAISLGLLFKQLESLLSKNDIKILNLLGVRYWVFEFAIHFTVTSLIFAFVQVGQTRSQFALTVPISLSISLATTVMSLIFLNTFTKNAQLDFSKFADKISKCWLLTMGMVSLLYFSVELNLHFGDRYLNVSISSMLIITAILFILFLIITLVHFYFSSKNIRENIALRVELGDTSSSLAQLKSQINPHFLFNSLNSIYGIALAEKSPKTADGVQKLSEMMRFMLKENTQEKISLNKEIEYIHNYIDLQSLRLDTNKHVQLNVSIEQPCDGNISPMLLIPMIENAFKHGVSIDKPSFIGISLKCNEHYVSLNVKNSNHHKEKTAAEESGIGLENVRKRLELLYPEKHLFQVYENEETYEAFIKIELA